ncbi:MAG: hypothetical protein HOM74_00990 [Proteobacteria bacterium]|nr:hypothetical protein [Pseudomonadota bacterium]
MTDAKQTEVTDPSKKTPTVKDSKKEDQIAKNNVGKTSLVSLSLTLALLLSLILGLAALTANYFLWQKINAGSQALQTDTEQQQDLFAASQKKQLAEFQQQIQNQIEQSDETNKKLSAELLALNASNQQLEKQIQNNSNVLHQDQRGWRLKELQYILRIAQHRLLLDRDIDGAIAALETTDNRLSEINQTDLLPLRKLIAQQLQKLASYPAPDYVGLQFKLDQLIIAFQNTYRREAHKASEKNIVIEETNTNTTVTEGNETADRSFLEETMDRAKTMLNQNVKLRQHTQTPLSFSAEQELTFSFQLIQEKLVTAKFAVSSRNDALFKQQLESAIDWLTKEPQLGSNPKLLETIKKLSGISLEPNLPDISAPYKLLEKLSVDSGNPIKEEATADREAL